MKYPPVQTEWFRWLGVGFNGFQLYLFCSDWLLGVSTLCPVRRSERPRSRVSGDRDGGACVGFLWWNAAPARIFMGDTGSLAIGTGLACIALEMNLQLLLPIVGGLFVIEAVSVIAQVVSFRVFRRRVFRMAPLHHHFELAGWPETTVIVRFWIISVLCTASIGIFYADFLSIGSVK